MQQYHAAKPPCLRRQPTQQIRRALSRSWDRHTQAQASITQLLLLGYRHLDLRRMEATLARLCCLLAHLMPLDIEVKCNTQIETCTHQHFATSSKLLTSERRCRIGTHRCINVFEVVDSVLTLVYTTRIISSAVFWGVLFAYLAKQTTRCRCYTALQIGNRRQSCRCQGSRHRQPNFQ